MRYLFLLLVITPITELWLILQVGTRIGVSATLALIFLTAVAGAVLLRRQGFSTLFRARQKMESGQLPAHEMVEGILLAFAGALMLTPGFLTDFVGFALLIPIVRHLLVSRLQRNFQFNSHRPSTGFETASHTENVIEGEFESLDRRTD